jgi:hypothetical protein
MSIFLLEAAPKAMLANSVNRAQTMIGDHRNVPKPGEQAR